jgi:hypothetical protein
MLGVGGGWRVGEEIEGGARRNRLVAVLAVAETQR